MQSAPFSLAVELIYRNSTLRGPVQSHGILVAFRVALTSIIGNDGALARSRIHELLELVALTNPHIVESNLCLALLHLVLPFLCCLFALFTCSPVLVKKATGESTTPSSCSFLCALLAMRVLATDR